MASEEEQDRSRCANVAERTSIPKETRKAVNDAASRCADHREPVVIEGLLSGPLHIKAAFADWCGWQGGHRDVRLEIDRAAERVIFTPSVRGSRVGSRRASRAGQ
jgi:hypothetical protein